MSKQDFELIARAVRQFPEDRNFVICHDSERGKTTMRDLLAAHFADALQTSNPRFDRKRFIAACNGRDATDSAGRKVRYSEGR